MSDDKKPTDKNSKASDDVETIEVIEAEEVIVEADEDETINSVDSKLDNLVPPIFNQSNSIGSLVIAALLGGMVSIALLFSIGYYLVTSSSLGGISQLLNDADETNVLEERYTNISTRILALEGEVSQTQLDIEGLAGKDNNQTIEIGSRLNAQSDDMETLAALVQHLQSNVEIIENKISDSINISANSIPPAVGQPINRDSLADVEVQIGELKSSLASLTNKQTSQTKISNAQDDLIANLTQKLDGLGETIVLLKQNIDINVKNTEQVNQAAITKGSGSAASALAVAALERALQDEKPFDAELDVLKSLVGNNATIEQLSDFAVTGIASEINLLGQFDELLEQALVADLKGEGKSVLDKFIGNAKSIISIRRTGNIEGNDIEAVLARMEVAVLAKDLRNALAQGQGLNGAAQETFSRWVEAVETRLLAKDLMRQLSGDILKSLQTAN